jgi:hypothetical protein
MKIFFCFFILITVCQSCFLFPKFKKESFSFNEKGQQKNFTVVIPKGFSKSEKRMDSSGNEEQFYYYPGGTSLYFVRVVDTAVQYQPINYELNIPKEIYSTVFFKRIDSANRLWRETRFSNYKLGYRSAEKGEDWKFDSAINYFSIHLR